MLRSIAFFAGVLLAVGCEEPLAPLVELRDAGPADASAPPSDATDSPGDAAVDSAVGSSDATTDSGSRCVSMTNELRATIYEDRLGLAAGVDSFATAWVGLSNGFREIEWAVFDATTDFASPNRGATELQVVASAPALVARADGFQLAFHAAPQGDYEIYGAHIGLDGLGSSPVRWTNRPGRDEQTALSAIDDQVRAAWIELDGLQRGAMFGSVSAAGVLESSARVATDIGAVSLVFSRDWVGWTGTDSAGTHALLANAASMSVPTRLSTEGNLDGSLDIASTATEGLAVFGINSGAGAIQVRARGFDATGAALESEVVISPVGKVARNPSVAVYGSGYVVAYRLVEAGSAAIELVFLGPQAQVRSRVALGTAAESGALLVRASADGQIGVLHSDAGGGVVFTRVVCD